MGQQTFGSDRSRFVLHARDPPTVDRDRALVGHVALVIREHLSDNASRLDGDAVGLLPGLVVGDTSGIDDRLDADAKATGITHLLAVSGSHFAILCGMVDRGAAAVRSAHRGDRRDAHPARPGDSGRAATVGAAGRADGWHRDARPVDRPHPVRLSRRSPTAVIALLLIDPELAVSVGFALSVLATGGLVLIAPAWSEALQRRGFPPGWADLLAVPVAAQIVTMPVIVLISGSVSVVGVLANLLVAPVVAPALVLGVLCALIGPWWSGAGGRPRPR